MQQVFLCILRVVSPRHLLHGGLEHLFLGQNIPDISLVPEHISASRPIHLKKRTKSQMFASLYPTPITLFISPYHFFAAGFFRPFLKAHSIAPLHLVGKAERSKKKEENFFEICPRPEKLCSYSQHVKIMSLFKITFCYTTKFFIESRRLAERFLVIGCFDTIFGASPILICWIITSTTYITKLPFTLYQ